MNKHVVGLWTVGWLLACSGTATPEGGEVEVPEPEAPAAELPTDDAVLAALKGSSLQLGQMDASCQEGGRGKAKATLAQVVRKLEKAAETKEITCEEGGAAFACNASFLGGENHWSLFLDFELDGDHALQEDTITCQFAG